MSISETISQTAATNPVVGVAVATSSTNSAILSGMATGDTATAGLLGAVSSQQMEISSLLASLTPTLGQNVNVIA